MVAEDCGWQVRVPGNTIWARDTGGARDNWGMTMGDRERNVNQGCRVSDKLAQQTSPTPQITDITIYETRHTDRQCNSAVTTKGTNALQGSTTQSQIGNDELLAKDKIKYTQKTIIPGFLEQAVKMSNINSAIL